MLRLTVAMLTLNIAGVSVPARRERPLRWPRFSRLRSVEFFRAGEPRDVQFALKLSF